MRSLLQTLAVALGISMPLIASAQSTTQSLTREQVRHEAAQYTAAGWNPARMNPRTWVDDAQAASAKVMTARAEVSGNQLASNKGSEAEHCN
ncbi:DUF4148 domain-containing protein [Caballeronia sp. LZ008]|uniref:DUF4148 domain-containing protein n=1 Tax=unclassified Caballeronia TaxID=2646786 RepID=UPI002027B411|nr:MULTISPECIES: DUF4148 domain-containing protein [unclassified Caballeronia]MDR5798121.1 DUF4148 domain-containing protein [Caballeronia sp. LZ008]